MKIPVQEARSSEWRKRFYIQRTKARIYGRKSTNGAKYKRREYGIQKKKCSLRTEKTLKLKHYKRKDLINYKRESLLKRKTGKVQKQALQKKKV